MHVAVRKYQYSHICEVTEEVVVISQKLTFAAGNYQVSQAGAFA